MKLSLESPLMNLLSQLADLILLNVLWLLCCVPIITAGAATAARDTVLLRMIRKNEDAIFRPFFSAFRHNFWTASKLYLIVFLISCLIACDLVFLLSYHSSVVIKVLVCIPVAIFALSYGYVFPLFAQFENTTLATLKNALILSLSDLSVSILVAGLTFLPLLVFFSSGELFLRTAIFWLFVGFTLTAYLRMLLLRKKFDAAISAGEK